MTEYIQRSFRVRGESTPPWHKVSRKCNVDHSGRIVGHFIADCGDEIVATFSRIIPPAGGPLCSACFPELLSTGNE